jgi:hypothetical protein
MGEMFMIRGFSAQGIEAEILFWLAPGRAKKIGADSPVPGEAGDAPVL